jgi:sugar phosphate isomerase/epimerase
MNQLSNNLSAGFLYKMNIDDILDEIFNSSFSLIELDNSPVYLNAEKVQSLRIATRNINKLKNKPNSSNNPIYDYLKTSAADEYNESSLEELMKKSEKLSESGTLHFIIHREPLPVKKLNTTKSHKQMILNIIESLKFVAKRCREQEMNSLFETMLPHMFFSHISDILCVFRAVEGKNVGICFDSKYSNLSGNIFDMMHKLSKYLHLIHDDIDTGIHDLGNNWEHMIKTMRNKNFHGTFILEYEDVNKYLNETFEEIQTDHNMISENKNSLALK